MTSVLGNLECKTVHGNQCIFPFKYKGVTYNECTKDHSENYKGNLTFYTSHSLFSLFYPPAWCATEVKSPLDIEVVRGTWEDCESACLLGNRIGLTTSRTKVGPPAPPPPGPVGSESTNLNIGAKYFHFFSFLFTINYIIFRSDLRTLCCYCCPRSLTRNCALQKEGHKNYRERNSQNRFL